MRVDLAQATSVLATLQSIESVADRLTARGLLHPSARRMPADPIVTALAKAGGTARITTIARKVGISTGAAGQRLRKHPSIVRKSRGIYALKG